MVVYLASLYLLNCYLLSKPDLINISELKSLGFRENICCILLITFIAFFLSVRILDFDPILHMLFFHCELFQCFIKRTMLPKIGYVSVAWNPLRWNIRLNFKEFYYKLKVCVTAYNFMTDRTVCFVITVNANYSLLYYRRRHPDRQIIKLVVHHFLILFVIFTYNRNHRYINLINPWRIKLSYSFYSDFIRTIDRTQCFLA